MCNVDTYCVFTSQSKSVVAHHTRIAEIGQLGIWRKSITNTLSGSIQQKFKTLNLFFYRL